eukprot:FR736781.1.p4 GENE.FR736781.1~~FR736781.1.p4  ORF type:complete len:108 (-),score=23.71 FR736781.1:690-1013(-)
MVSPQGPQLTLLKGNQKRELPPRVAAPLGISGSPWLRALGGHFTAARFFFFFFFFFFLVYRHYIGSVSALPRALPRHYHGTTTALPRHYHGTTTALPRHYHGTTTAL